MLMTGVNRLLALTEQKWQIDNCKFIEDALCSLLFTFLISPFTFRTEKIPKLKSISIPSSHEVWKRIQDPPRRNPSWVEGQVSLLQAPQETPQTITFHRWFSIISSLSDHGSRRLVSPSQITLRRQTLCHRSLLTKTPFWYFHQVSPPTILLDSKTRRFTDRWWC